MRLRILAPWSRAPSQLLRQPVVAAALAVAAFLIAIPASAASLFLSSAGNATLNQLVDDSCTWTSGMHLSAPLQPGQYRSESPRGQRLFDRRVEIATSNSAGLPHLTAPVVTLLGGGELTGARLPDRSALTVVARTGFADHVRVLDGGTGKGVWLPDEFARLQQLTVGERVSLDTGGGRVTLPVAAIFRDLRAEPDTQFWCTLRDTIRGKLFSNQPVYPVAFVPHADFLTAHADADATMIVERGIDDTDLTTSSIRPTVAALDRLPAQVRKDSPDDAWPEFVGYGSRLATNIGSLSERSDLVVSALSGTVVPLAVAGSVAGLVIAAAGGAFWADRRRRELAVLSTRGVGGAALGAKAALEAALPVAAGAVAGWFGARAILGAWGPSPLVTESALATSIGAAAGAFVLTLAVIAAVAGVRAAKRADPPPARTRTRRRVPWELLLIVAGLASWFLLDADVHVDTAESTGRVARIPPPLVVTPALLIAGLAVLCARLVFLALERRRDKGPRGLAANLAYRRIVAAPLAAAILIGATAVPVALSLYGETVTASVQRTIDTEADLIVGADTVLDFNGEARLPDELAGRATVVTRYREAQLSGSTVDVLGVDPAAFTRVAAWDDLLPGPALAELAAELHADGRPVALVDGVSDLAENATLHLRSENLPVTIRDVEQLPGKSPTYPLVIVHQDVLERLVPDANQQLWVRGDPDRAMAVANRAGLDVVSAANAADVHAAGVYAGITYTFTFLAALSTLTGVIVVVGVLLYLDARSRSGRGAYVLLRRMGVGAGAHGRALLAEVGGLLLAGFTLGVLLAAAAVAFTAPGFDLDPATAPGTLVDLPWPLVLALALAVAITAALGSAAAQRVISAGKPSEVLRDTE